MAEQGCKLFIYGVDQNMANGDLQAKFNKSEWWPMSTIPACEKSMTDNNKNVQRYISELKSLFHEIWNFGAPLFKMGWERAYL